MNNFCFICIQQQKDTEIESLNEKLKHLTDEYNTMQCLPKLKQLQLPTTFM